MVDIESGGVGIAADDVFEYVFGRGIGSDQVGRYVGLNAQVVHEGMLVAGRDLKAA